MGQRSVVAPLVGSAAFAWSAWLARRHDVSGREEAVFRRFNDAPDELCPPVWTVTQAGSLGAVFAATELVRRRGRRAEALTVLATGASVWGGVKLVKPLIGRGRPDQHLDAVRVRGGAQTGLGFPSGHAAVATTLALLVTSRGPLRAVALTVAATAGVGRMYVGAHLPLDVVGGFAAGTIAAAAARRLGTS